MQRYVTYMTTYSGDKLPRYYIGSASEARVLSGDYFGSVSSKKFKTIFHQEIKENKNLFSIEILSYHETRSEAFLAELALQISHDVVNSPDFINQAVARNNGFYRSHGPLSEDHKASLSKSLLGKKHSKRHRSLTEKEKAHLSESSKKFRHSEETKLRIAASKRGKPRASFSEEACRNIGLAAKGRKASDNAKLNMSHAQMGNQNGRGRKGLKHSEETIRLISERTKSSGK